MPNQILFAGGRRESITVLSGTVTETTSVGNFNSTYSDCALELQGSGNVFKVDLYSETSNALSKTTVSGTGTKIFVHAVINYGASAFVPTNRMIQLVDSSGFPWFSVRGGSGFGGASGTFTNSFGIFWNSGTGASPVWSLFGGNAESIPSGTVTWDIEFTFGSPHLVRVYLNGALWKSGSFTQSLFTNISEVQFAGTSSAGSQPTIRFSEIIVTEGISTVGAFVSTERPTAAGANAGFTNNHTAVNEVVGSDATLQSANTTGVRTTHVMSDIVVPTGLEIASVFLWMRAKNNNFVPAGVRSVLRSGGIDYVSPDIPLIGFSYSPVGARYNLDVLGTPWSEAEWNGIEAGYEVADGTVVPGDPAFTSVVLLLRFNGTDGSTTFTDLTGKTMTAVGNAQIDTAQSKFGGASGLFDGSGDFITTPDNAAWHFATGPFCIELFVRHDTKINNTAYVGQWDGAWFFYTEGGQLKFRARATNNDLLDLVYNWTPVSGQWYHICAERNPSNRMRLYIDGVMVASTNTTFARDLANGTALLRIGRINDSFPGYDFQGHIDELRITKGVARYDSDFGFPVPTAEYPYF